MDINKIEVQVIVGSKNHVNVLMVVTDMNGNQCLTEASVQHMLDLVDKITTTCEQAESIKKLLPPIENATLPVTKLHMEDFLTLMGKPPNG